jgi:hypothetical protein
MTGIAGITGRNELLKGPEVKELSSLKPGLS